MNDHWHFITLSYLIAMVIIGAIFINSWVHRRQSIKRLKHLQQSHDINDQG